MNSILVTLVLVCLSSLSPMAQGADAKATPAKEKKIKIEEFDTLRAKPNFQVLDVRSQEEFKAGHVAGAKNLSVNDPEFAKKLTALDKSKTYLVHCARGKRSAIATDQMLKAGLTNVLDFSGGFESWIKAGKPVEK